MTKKEYIGIVKDGAFVALLPEPKAAFPPEHEELDLTKCEGNAIMIRSHGGGGEWV